MRVLLQHRRASGFIENLLDRALAQTPLPPADRGLCLELTYGAVRWERTLDWLIERKTQGRTQKAALQLLLQLGLYQMFWLGRIPDHAAVHETVDLARKLGFGPQSGFVNAILRAYGRERAATEALLEQLKTSDPALGHSHPDFLTTRWEARWGRPETIRLLEWDNSPPPTFARRNSLKIDSNTLSEIWAAEGVQVLPQRYDWAEEGLVFQLLSHPPLASLPSFQQGFFYLQDPSTLLAVHQLDPQPGEKILDLCAAPGGKSTFIAQLMQNQGHLLAQDNDPVRLDRLRENCLRLGVTCLDASLWPEAPAAGAVPLFDRILVDAPCSNTGVLRRRVEARWRFQAAELHRLAKAQVELLAAAALLLRPGGLLVYSTCSLEPEENAGVLANFLSAHPRFTLESQRELWPFRDGVDGAFVARLRSSGSGSTMPRPSVKLT